MLATLILVVLALLVVGGWAFFHVPWFNKWVKDSEVIVATRISTIFAIFMSMLYEADPNGLTNAIMQIISTTYFAYWGPLLAIFLPIFLEWLRKRRDPEMQ